MARRGLVRLGEAWLGEARHGCARRSAVGLGMAMPGRAMRGKTNMETIAEKIAAHARKCAICGWEWLKKPHLPEPKRCPNHACRSKEWRGKVASDA